jgi:galactosylceramidase
MVDPHSDNFTLQVVKISHDHAPCTRPKLPDFNVSAENVTFSLAQNMRTADGKLAVWRSNFEKETAILFERQADISVEAGGSFTLEVQIGDFFTVSTVQTATRGKPKTPVPKSVPQLPLPHVDNFDSYPESQDAEWLSDQIGAFEIHSSKSSSFETNSKNLVLRQMVPQLPIGWADHGSNGPMTLVGMREWQDISVQVDFMLPTDDATACVGSRVDQMWRDGIVICVGVGGRWNLTIGGPPQNLSTAVTPILTGTGPSIRVGEFHTLSLTTINDVASASVDRKSLFVNATVRNIDTGFAAIGLNTWLPVEFDNLKITKAGGDLYWGAQVSALPKGCSNPSAGRVVSVRHCVPNGFAAEDQQFELLADWQLRHIPSQLCLEYKSDTESPTLEICEFNEPKQQFRNDYTRIRNSVVPVELTTLPGGTRALVGNLDGSVSTPKGNLQMDGNAFNTWSYFPNTFQLRNQYTANLDLGYPLCLSACARK